MAEIKDKITKQRDDLTQALARLKEAVALPPTRIHKDATIQRFEITFELAWKLLQTAAAINGINEYGPKNSIRSAAQLNLIDDPGAWIEALNKRNLTIHVYREDIADAVYEEAKVFVPLVEKLLTKVREQKLLSNRD